MDAHVRLLRRQYLQLVEPTALSFPAAPSTLLHSPGFQAALYSALFAPNAVPHPPPERYTTRVLKRLVTLLSPPRAGAGIQGDEEPVIPPAPPHKVKAKVAATEKLPKREINESLLEAYTNLLSRPTSITTTTTSSSSSSSPSSTPITDIDTARSYVTYILPPSPASGREIGQPITLHESRHIISGQGTTGLRTWEAALALSEYLICTHLAHIYKNAPFAAAVEGTRVIRETDSVLELGAGTGLVAVVAARLGAKRILATDGDSGVCEALLRNVGLNGVGDCVTVRKRLWGDGEVVVKNGGADEEEKFDVVLGADVTYDATSMSLLVKELERLFTRNPAVKVIISATIRNESTFETFEDACRKSRLVLKQRAWEPLKPEMFFYTLVAPIRIIHISRSET